MNYKDRVYRDYFEYDGKKYYTGTVVVMKQALRPNFEATFVCYEPDDSTYTISVNGKRRWYHEKPFWRDFVCVTEKVDKTVKMPILRQKFEFDIPGMGAAWMLYIFVMIAGLIFIDFVWIWVFASMYFFSWRHEKIEKEGYYIEW